MRKSTPGLTAALEDYLEAIYHLCRHDKHAHSRDIAENLKVHKSTVTAALKSLGQLNLINYSPYEAVTLTLEGRKIAEDVVSRHSALKDFFTEVLSVEEGVAEEAACGMEHSIPREIVDKLVDFANFVKTCPRNAENWLDSFKEGHLADCRTSGRCRVCSASEDGSCEIGKQKES